MISLDRVKINCPTCRKLICTMEQWGDPKGIYFWCPRCKEEFEIKTNKKYRAHEANDR